MNHRQALYLLYSHYASDPRPRRQAEALRDAGWDVTVLALRNEDEPAVMEVNGVRVVGLQTGRYRGGALGRYLRAYLAFSASAFAWVHRHRGRFSFVHVHAPPDFLAFAALPARWSGSGLLLDVHDPTPELFAERFGDRGFPVAVAKRVERLSAGSVHHVLTVNEPVRRILEDRGQPPDRLSVVLNLPDERIFWRDVVPDPPETPVLAYHGTLVPRYGPQVLLEAAARLLPAFPDLRVRILGDGDLKPQLVTRAARPDLLGKVEFSATRIPVHEIPAALGAVTAGVVANGTEGFSELVLPTKLLEYLALGIPAVATRTRTIDHYFQPGQLTLVDAPDPGAIAQALDPLLRDPHRARETVVRARQFFDRHRWELESARYVELVDRVSRAGGRRGDAEARPLPLNG